MSPHTSFRINSPKVTHETIDGEVVIVNLDSGNYYSLDRVGADIWSLIEEGVGLDKIIVGIADRYEGDHAEIDGGVNRLISDLLVENLILVGDINDSEAAPSRFSPEGGGATKHPFEVPVLHKYTDMQDLLLLDPIHEVDDMGWPSRTADLPIEDKHHES